MKLGERPKLIRGLRQESRRLRLPVIVIGFFVVSLTFVVVSKPEANPFSSWKAEGADKAGDEPQHETTLPTVPHDTTEDASQTELLGNRQCGDGGSCRQKGMHKLTLPTVSNYTINDSTPAEAAQTQQDESTSDAEIKQEDKAEQAQFESGMDTETRLGTNAPETEDKPEPTQQGTLVKKMELKPLCEFSSFRANVCEMDGEIRIPPNSTSIMFMEAPDLPREELWKLKPYPRKGDELCLSHVTELTVKTCKVAPPCTRHHSVPGLVFSITGYTGNLFHDFTDVMVPLFTTANQFNGEVQFLITDMQRWWVNKYQKVLRKLSNYPVIDFNKNDQVHCFKHVIVGLHAFMEFTIDSSKAPNNYSMVDFSRFMRRSYSVQREATTVVGEDPNVKPRLLIISRKRTRMFTNLNEIVASAEELGYEVEVDEANVSSDLSRFASIVNSCDVMMGVHGAGLTNCVFLPPNATLIQVVPWGGLDGIAKLDFGNPATAMGLRYKQYSITVNESSLTEKYPRDHEIFKNPFALHKRGFAFIRGTFLRDQNVRLDVGRFKSLLLEVLDHLNP